MSDKKSKAIHNMSMGVFALAIILGVFIWFAAGFVYAILIGGGGLCTAFILEALSLVAAAIEDVSIIIEDKNEPTPTNDDE